MITGHQPIYFCSSQPPLPQSALLLQRRLSLPRHRSCDLRPYQSLAVLRLQRSQSLCVGHPGAPQGREALLGPLPLILRVGPRGRCSVLPHLALISAIIIRWKQLCLFLVTFSHDSGNELVLCNNPIIWHEGIETMSEQEKNRKQLKSPATNEELKYWRA